MALYQHSHHESVGSTQGAQVLAAKDLGEGLDGKEKVSAFGGNPSVMLGRQGTAGDHAVNMDVVLQNLIPGMKHHRDAQLTSEPFGIASKGLQSRCSIKEASDILLVPDDRQLRGFFGSRQKQCDIGTAQGDTTEKAQAVDLRVTGSPG